jgi:hypothetical protein
MAGGPDVSGDDDKKTTRLTPTDGVTAEGLQVLGSCDGRVVFGAGAIAAALGFESTARLSVDKQTQTACY